ncbi:hypothetical protein CRD60_03915 [Bifidobacterium aemilianum]|uniref:RNA-binding protein n=1 Tax=Bifidobacterium aemilianum TaxID=2493120 RepID=A0A366KAR7_9BIFI|nr:DUF721 domain-containing protein [Bifidobacterium aemilianum]RBP97761.1 hypothetical protein CRD60_03915 [Bifidobacterium aemilianum]
MEEPIARKLHLDPRKLPALVFNKIDERAKQVKYQEKDRELAWESFGKPGRDPKSFAGLFGSMAAQGGWVPHMKIAQLRNHWDQVVGSGIAQHSQVVSYEDGLLTIRAESQIWATQLTYMIPQLTATIRQRLEGLEIREIKVTGPHNGSFGSRYGRRYGGYGSGLVSR